MPAVEPAAIEALKAEILKPLDTFEQYKNATTDPDINPNYIKPTHVHVPPAEDHGRIRRRHHRQFTTNEALLKKALELLAFLKEDSDKLAAANLHELMRCWENVHRMWQAEAHVRTMLFREETRWPGYYFRADKPQHRRREVARLCKLPVRSQDQHMGRSRARPIRHIFVSQPKEPALASV